MKKALGIPPDYFEYLRGKLISGEITAITFDTQIFDRNGRTFRGGLIGQLVRLKSSHLKLIITELVRDEAKKHMLAMHRIKAIKVEEALSQLRNHLSEELFEEVQDELNSRLTPESIVWQEFNEFFLATDAEIISYEETSARKLFNRYFMNEPPFQKQNLKKSEFPDALALLCLEEVSLNYGILVVSEDSDWTTFCRDSQAGNLYCVPDLGVALSLITSVESDIKEIADQRYQQFKYFSDSGALSLALKEKFSKGLRESVIFIGRTSFFYTAICAGVDILVSKMSEGKSFGKIREDSGGTSWVLNLDFDCCITSDVSFATTDESFVGSSRYQSLLTVPSMSIIKVASDGISIETVVNKQTSVNLGAIGPDEYPVAFPAEID